MEFACFELTFSLIERVILSAGAMLIFSVSFQIDQMPEGRDVNIYTLYKDMSKGFSLGVR